MKSFVWFLAVIGWLSLWTVASNVQAAPSVGCGAVPPEAPNTVEVGGQTRSFILALPDTYDADTPHALVFTFHGRTSPADEVRSYYDLEPHLPATLGEAIVVYPVALTQPDGTFGWWNAGDAPDALRDFELFDVLLAQLGEATCIDAERVYAVGHSLGGSFVNALGCHRAGVLRAVASLGSGPGAACEGEVAAMVLHHPDDRLVAFSYGVAARDQYLEQNRLSGPPIPAEPRSLNCERYGAAGITNPVLWCPHTQSYSYGGRYYPHNWPAVTGAAVMRFFASLP